MSEGHREYIYHAVGNGASGLCGEGFITDEFALPGEYDKINCAGCIRILNKRVEALAAAAPREVPEWFQSSIPIPHFNGGDAVAQSRAYLARYAPDVLGRVEEEIANLTQGHDRSMKEHLRGYCHMPPALDDLVRERFQQLANDWWVKNKDKERALEWPVWWARDVLERLDRRVVL